MSIILNSSGGGSITIQEPSTASNFTHTLPAATGTVVLSGTTPTLNGITFPATQVPSADANTLDDYEEGTWTPSVGGNATYSVQTGNYVKIGKLVYIRGTMTINTIGTGTQNQLVGLPFTLASVSANGGAMPSIGYWANFATNVIAIYGAADGGSTNLYFGSKSSSGNTLDWTTNIFGNSSRIDFNMTYIASA
jgi:hypothetical protein